MGYGKSLTALLDDLRTLPMEALIEALNNCREALHDISPFRTEPVDCVLWVPAEQVVANDYDPNVVAPPEMRLLELSVKADGYTQPIVSYGAGKYYEVVDGFHRNRVGKECTEIRERVHGYLPITRINAGREGRCDRIAATHRHNRARGKHLVAAMSDVVLELSQRGWSDEKIGREMGMEPDEVLRLKQITGMASLFADSEFSQSWEFGEEYES